MHALNFSLMDMLSSATNACTDELQLTFLSRARCLVRLYEVEQNANAMFVLNSF